MVQSGYVVALPYVLIGSAVLEGHHTKSMKENSRLRKTFVYLVFYVLLLPSAALASVDSLAEFFGTPRKNACVYLFYVDPKT